MALAPTGQALRKLESPAGETSRWRKRGNDIDLELALGNSSTLSSSSSSSWSRYCVVAWMMAGFSWARNVDSTVASEQRHARMDHHRSCATQSAGGSRRWGKMLDTA